MTDLEDAFSEYVEAVKEEYYKASISVDTRSTGEHQKRNKGSNFRNKGGYCKGNNNEIRKKKFLNEKFPLSNSFLII